MTSVVKKIDTGNEKLKGAWVRANVANLGEDEDIKHPLLTTNHRQLKTTNTRVFLKMLLIQECNSKNLCLFPWRDFHSLLPVELFIIHKCSLNKGHFLQKLKPANYLMIKYEYAQSTLQSTSEASGYLLLLLLVDLCMICYFYLNLCENILQG